jgi:hypothetical protein
MANNRDDEMYPRNDDIVVCEPVRTRRNATTGAEETIPITDLTGLVYYVSSNELAESSAEAVHQDLVISLPQIGTTGVYTATLTGAAKAARLAAQADSTVLYEHWQDGTRYHEVASFIWRKRRVAE